MADNVVRNIAPFINDRFLITSPWWTERINPVTGETKIHRGLDIATSGSKPVYSMLTGIIHSKGTDSSRGNWVIIYDNNPNSQFYGYATMYMHLVSQPTKSIGDSVNAGEYIADEGTTGQSTGIHLHVEMQDLNRWGGEWHWSYNKSDYLDPTVFMGIDNVKGTWWIYNGTVPPIPTPKRGKNNSFKWVLYAKKLRDRRLKY